MIAICLMGARCRVFLHSSTFLKGGFFIFTKGVYEMKKTIASSQSLARGRCPDGSPNPIDLHVGKRLFLRRKILHLSQEHVANLLGISFQQIQKYEKGVNRISASRLWDFAQILKVDIDYFFQDMPKDIIPQNDTKRYDPVSTPFEATTEFLTLLYYIDKISHLPAAKHLFEAMYEISSIADRKDLLVSQQNQSDNRGK